VTEPRVIQMMGGHPAFWCPVCQHPHWLNERWKWNGDRDKPTFSAAAPGQRFSFLSYLPPSEGTYHLLKRNDRWFRYGSAAPVEEKNASKFGQRDFAERTAAEHADDNDGAGWGVVERFIKTPRKVFCHSYVKDGMLQLLPDTPGPLGGTTVPLKPWSLNDDGSYRAPD
jgi:hypothetical protein